MGTRLPITLPYGLSREHQSFFGEDTPKPKQYGPLRFCIPSLSGLVAPSRSHSQTLPPLAASITTSAPGKQLRTEKPKKSAVGLKSNDPKTSMAPQNDKEKYRRSRKNLKPSTSISTTFEDSSASRRKTKNALNIRADLRLGASHDMPIMLDSHSDESELSDVRLRDTPGIISSPVSIATSVPNIVHSQYQHRNSLTGPRQRSRSPTPLQNEYISSGFSLHSSTLTHALDTPVHSSSSGSEISIAHKSTAHRQKSPYTMPHATGRKEPKNSANISKRRRVTGQSEFVFSRRPTNIRDGRSSGIFLRTKVKTPGPWRFRHLHNKSENQMETFTTSPEQEVVSSQLPGKDSEMPSSLVDIDDFELRSKVAQLMAVAPALPVRDLYYLIIVSEGHMLEAKKKAMRMSEAPCAFRMSNKQTCSRPRTIPKGFDNNDDESNMRDIKVKIDPDNFAFEWDDDEPTMIPTSTLNARSSKSNLRNKPANYYHLPPSAKMAKCTETSGTYSRSIAKRSKVSFSKHITTRDTSSDRGFVVADSVIEYVLDSGDSGEPDVPCYTPCKKSVLPRRKYSMI